MKKFIFSLITVITLIMPHMNLFARRGSDAALAAGLIGTAMITTAVASSGRRRAREAEREAIRAQQEAQRAQYEARTVKHEQRQFQRQQMMAESKRTTNILIFAIIMLFLGLLGLGALILKKK